MFSNYFRTLLYFRTLFSSSKLRCSVFSNIVRKWKMFSYLWFSNIVQFLFFSVLFTNFKVGKVLKNPLFTRISEIGLCKCFLCLSLCFLCPSLSLMLLSISKFLCLIAYTLMSIILIITSVISTINVYFGKCSVLYIAHFLFGSFSYKGLFRF